MILKRVKLHNIRSYDHAEVEFPEGSTLLSGDIGAGKTTILMGIEFAFFGLQPGQKGSSLLRNGCDEGSIQLEILMEGNPIVLKRRLKKGKSITQDSASIHMNGSEREMSISELKSLVLQLLNYPAEFAKKTNLLYKFTVYTPQEEMKQIILEDPETRLNTLRYIFGVDKYKRIRENTLLFAAKLREKIRAKEGLIQDIPEKMEKIAEKEKFIQEVIKKIQDSKKNLLLFQEERKKFQTILDEVDQKTEEKRGLEKEMEKTKAMITGKKEMMLSQAGEEEYLNKQIKEIEQLSLDARVLQQIEGEKKGKIHEEELLRKEFLELSGVISSLQLRVHDAKKLKEQILKLQLCPTCLQNVDNNYKENIIAKFDMEHLECQAKIENLLKKKIDIASSLDHIKQLLLEFEKQYRELQMRKVKIDSVGEKKSRIQEIEKGKALIHEDIKILESHLMTLKESLLRFGNLDALYKIRKQDFDRASEKEKDAEIKVAELKKEVEITERQILEFQKEIQEKEFIKRELNHLIELEQWLSEQFLEIVSFIEKNIMLKLREEFSKVFHQWFSILVQDSFLARLNEDFTPIIEQQDYELDYAHLSGGERTAVALAYRLALCQVINSMLSSIKTRDLIILDEPTDGFSEQQLDKVRDIFQQLKVKQLIVVSHEQKIEGFVENVIKCRKENGITRVEV